MAFKLITAGEVRSLLKGSVDGSFDVLIHQIIAGVGQEFENHLNRRLDKKSYTEFFGSDGRVKRLWVKNPPIAATPALQLFDDPDRVYGAETELAAADYVIFEEEGKVELVAGLFSKGPRTVKVVYTGGYLTADGVGAPDDLRLAAMMQSAFIFQRRADLGLSGRSLEGGSLSLEGPVDLLPQVRKILEPYRRFPVGGVSD